MYFLSSFFFFDDSQFPEIVSRSPSVGEKRELGGMYERGVDFPVFRLKFLSSVPTIFLFFSECFFSSFFLFGGGQFCFSRPRRRGLVVHRKGELRVKLGRSAGKSGLFGGCYKEREKGE